MGRPPGIETHPRPLPTRELLARHPLARLSLIRLREKLGKSRPVLAQEIGIARTRLFQMEIGTRNPSLNLMREWIEALGQKPTLELLDKLFGEPRRILEGPNKPGRRRRRRPHVQAEEAAA